MADITTEVLIEIRDELRKTNVRLDGTNERLGGIDGRLEGTIERLDRLERRQVESEIRLATEIVAVVGAVHELRDTLLEDRQLARQVSDHERRIAALETRG